MTSTFGWLDRNDEQSKAVLDLIAQYKVSETIDEIGIGSIRDTFADALFPGTSTLHTRLRYALFIPWLLQRSAQQQTPDAMEEAMRTHEISLIYALLDKGEDGVIGAQAKATLKRMPSAVYWAQLMTWGVVRSPSGRYMSMKRFFRHAHASKSIRARAMTTDDPESWERSPLTALDPDLPEAPSKLLSSVTFDLTPDEGAYLSTRIVESVPESLLAWFVNHPPTKDAHFVWDLEPDEIAEFPPRLRSLVDHGRRFHTIIHGAGLVYNLLLTEKSEEMGWGEQVEGWVDHYQSRLDDWRADLESSGAMIGWNRREFWHALTRENPRIPPRTRAFVDDWWDILTHTTPVVDSPAARRLIAERERQIKGRRARLANAQALETWRGDSGLTPLDYRWRTARQFLSDLHAAGETTDGA
ncbi:DUF6361 family protein [Brevibacterium sp.]|uniref:DUF6361 family protein n=1 Tax=Brevibacterium sp. TaxID=1701 RepID=UPI0028110464|nr:DUF6361 family protein [Brevibacterium sp.]